MTTSRERKDALILIAVGIFIAGAIAGGYGIHKVHKTLDKKKEKKERK